MIAQRANNIGFGVYGRMRTFRVDAVLPNRNDATTPKQEGDVIVCTVFRRVAAAL